MPLPTRLARKRWRCRRRRRRCGRRWRKQTGWPELLKRIGRVKTKPLGARQERRTEIRRTCDVRFHLTSTADGATGGRAAHQKSRRQAPGWRSDLAADNEIAARWPAANHRHVAEIGRASCRERVEIAEEGV